MCTHNVKFIGYIVRSGGGTYVFIYYDSILRVCVCVCIITYKQTYRVLWWRHAVRAGRGTVELYSREPLYIIMIQLTLRRKSYYYYYATGQLSHTMI